MGKLERLVDINRVLFHVLRYLLGTAMLMYAIVKLVNVQFQVSPFTYTRPLDQVPGRMLAWTVLGYAPWFQRLLGMAELVPSLLLLFRRTARLGAILMFPVVLNVTLMNFALDLWDDTKIISSVLLGIDVYLLLSAWPQLAEALKTVLGPPRVVRPLFRWLEAAVAVLIAISWCFYDYYGYERDAILISDFTGVRQINGAGAWMVEGLRIDGKDAIPQGQQARLYFDVWQHVYYAQSETTPCPQRGPMIPNHLLDKRAYRDRLESCSYFAEDRLPVPVESEGTFDADRSHHSFQLTNLTFAGSSGDVVGTYTANGARLLMDGTRNGEKVQIGLKRLNWGPMW